ncbi:hypothetical protein ACLB2K_049685 [Fragaria x ananassa]
MEYHQSYPYSNYDFQSQTSHLHADQSDHYLTSVPILQSVPSLISQSHNQENQPTYHHCLTTLQGHNSYISSLTISGNFIYTGSSDREIRSWKCNPYFESNNENLSADHCMVSAGKGAVKSLAISGDKIFSAHQDHKIRVWKIENNKLDHLRYSRLATLPTLGDRAAKLLMPKHQVQIRRHKKCTWIHHVDTVSALALSRDESLLFCFMGSNAQMAVSLEDERVYTGSADKKIKVWKKELGEKKHSLIATLEKHNSGVNALALSSDGCVLYSGACDRSIVVWEKIDSEGNMGVVGALRGHTKSILCLAVVSDLVCSGSADQTIRIWRGVARSYSCLEMLEGHKGPVKCLTATVDHCNTSDTSSYLIYSGGLDCDIKVWQVRNACIRDMKCMIHETVILEGEILLRKWKYDGRIM